MDLELREAPCSAPWLVTLPARLSHYEGQGGGEMRGKKNPTGAGLRNGRERRRGQKSEDRK